MSDLIFNGDLVNDLGRALPSPYIDNIFITDNSINLRINLMFEEDDTIDVFNRGSVVSYSTAQRRFYSGLYYYVMIFYNLEQEDMFDKIISGDLNPLILYARANGEYGEVEGNTTATRRRLIGDGLFQLRALPSGNITSTTPEEVYDAMGNKISKFRIGEIINLNTFGGEISWDDINSLNIICFSSIVEYDQDTFLTDYENDLPLLEQLTGDISYENVVRRGVPLTEGRLKFVDSSDAIYSQTPLLSIELLPYKINRINHRQVVNRIQKLLDSYENIYNTPRGHTKLKRMMDNISAVLASSADSESLLYRIDSVRKTFPDKTPVAAIGRFYRELSKEIVAINRILTNSERLFRKNIYTGKVVDLRSLALGERIAESYSDTKTYLYPSWQASKVDVSDRVEDAENSYTIVFGHFFFDYEKALRYNSRISRVFDANKLEQLGLNIPYTKFRLNKIILQRSDRSNSERSRITLNFSDEYQYPRMSTIALFDNRRAGEHMSFGLEPGLVGYSERAAGTPYGGMAVTGSTTGGETFTTTEGDTPQDGFLSSVVLRPYVNPAAEALSPSIENYRLMCFELLDYQYDSSAVTYSIDLTIEDNTIDLRDTLSDSYREAYDELKAYYEAAIEQCSYNDDIGQFNDFFREGVLNFYGTDVQNYPWYRSAITYILHLDLINNTYNGDMEEIRSAAQTIVAQINPITGTLEQLEAFEELMRVFYFQHYGPAGELSDPQTKTVIKEYSSTVDMPIYNSSYDTEDGTTESGGGGQRPEGAETVLDFGNEEGDDARSLMDETTVSDINEVLGVGDVEGDGVGGGEDQQGRMGVDGG